MLKWSHVVSSILFLQQISQSFSPMDHWILCKLSDATETCNTGFEEYDFPAVTGAIYKFWVHHLCDFYLVSVKSSEVD